MEPVVGAVGAIKNVQILNRSINKDCRLPGPKSAGIDTRWLFVCCPVGGDATTGRDSGLICRGQVLWGGHFALFLKRSYSNFTPMADTMRWSAAGIFNGDDADRLPVVVGGSSHNKVGAVHEEIGAQFAAGRFASFEESPKKQDCADDCRPQRSYGEPQIEAGHAVGLSNLFDGSPLRAKVCIFLALRILAIGLIALGYRLSSHIIFEARLTGGLIIISGMALFAGIIELVGYS